MSELLRYLIASFGGGAFVFVVFLYLFLRYPEKIERIASIILKLFAYVSKKAERRRIITYLNSNLEIQRKKIEEILPGSIPFSLRIEFVDIENPDIFKQDDLLILKMKNHKNDSKNLAYATSFYVSKGLLPYSKRYIEKQISDSIDYMVTKEMIKKDVLALDWLINIFEDQFQDKMFGKILHKTEKIHDEGFLIRICLREYQKFGRLYPKEPTNKEKLESKQFFNKIYEIVSKKRGIDVNPTYNGNIIKIRIVPLYAKGSLISGIDRHHRFIQHSIRDGYKDFYIISAGNDINQAIALINILKTDQKLGLTERFINIYKGKYHGQEMKLLCSLVSITKSDKEQKTEQAKLYGLL